MIGVAATRINAPAMNPARRPRTSITALKNIGLITVATRCTA
jgi:hypothetical protein